jgi:hypothetical protein
MWLAGVALLCYAPFYRVPKAEDFYVTKLKYSIVHTSKHSSRDGRRVVIRSTQGKNYEIHPALLPQRDAETVAALLRESTEATVWLTDPEDKYIRAIKADSFEVPVATGIAWFESEHKAYIWLGLFMLGLGGATDYWESMGKSEQKAALRKVRRWFNPLSPEQKRIRARAKRRKRRRVTR